MQRSQQATELLERIAIRRALRSEETRTLTIISTPTVLMPTTGPLPILAVEKEQDILLGTVNPALPTYRRRFMLASYRAAYLHQSVPMSSGLARVVQVFYDPYQPWRIMGHVCPMGEAS